ncbi:MAG: DUF1553 domain-containing protein [Candidatus Hydrogenedentes bacterium]|nr:DUF1553 domain-containing protein [Candidatus Hydrogenedentota bacterium]
MNPAVPAFLPHAAIEGRRETRLDLAQWLTAPENPLTSRVIVNRMWKKFYGAGLSRVLEDVGTRGDWPTHPELLDWLAAEFRDSGWDVKRLVKLMVTSAAYRQTSTASKELREADPDNKWLERQSTFRLAAEFVRDNALKVSGLLSEKMGGPSVYPYQPDGYYADCNTFRGPLIYDPSKGEDQYRRGLYTFWKRSFLHPSLLAFDSPTREECAAERVVSNTPLQALVLLNDPTYNEAARCFAGHILKEGGATAADRITWAYRQAVSRKPTAGELSILTDLCAKHLKEYQSDKDAAAKLIHIGLAPPPDGVDLSELAAWTSVARAVLNLHETVARL